MLKNFRGKLSPYFIDLEKNPDLRKIPVRRVILFTNARDEKNIQEWVAHHLLLGFSLVYIFDHKSTIPINSLFTDPKYKGRVIVERCEMDGAIKLPLMKRASLLAGAFKTDWMLYLDADEFLVLNNFYGVKQMLNRFYFADSIAVNWLMFGSSHHIQEPEGLILDNYTYSDNLLNPHVKSFVRPSQVLHAGTPHYFNIVHPGRMFSIRGTLMDPASYSFHNWAVSYDNSHAYIAHFIYQSEETYKKRKIFLPRDDNGGSRETDSNIHLSHNDSINETVKNKYSERVRLFLAGNLGLVTLPCDPS